MPVQSAPSAQDHEELHKRCIEAHDIGVSILGTDFRTVEGIDELFYLAARLATAASDITGYINMLVNVEHYNRDAPKYNVYRTSRDPRMPTALKDFA